MILKRLLISIISVVVVCGSALSQTPTPVPSSTSPAGATIADLQTSLRQVLAKPEIRRGMLGVKVASVATGKVVFEDNAEKYFMPASNMKNFTVATAIERLGPDHRFVTSLYTAAVPDAYGTIKGDLIIYGRGDVSMSPRFNGGDAGKTLDALVEKIVSLGIKRVEGDIVGDDSYFRGFAIPQGWEWDDLQWSYGAEVSALPLNDSVIDITVRPGPAGYTCTVKMSPYNTVIRVVNHCLTGVQGSVRTLNVHKRLDQNILEISGTLPIGDDGFSGSISVSRPAELFASLVKLRLAEEGITVTGNYRYEKRSDGSLPSGVEIAKIESAPLSIIAANTMKPSQNMYTETLLWSLGEYARARDQVKAGNVAAGANRTTADSAEIGIAEVKSFLISIGVPPDGIIQYDGSGLSRHNLITPAAVVQLYTYMAKQSRYSQVWRDALTIGGVDGTLRNRFRGTRASGNVRGKTGTIDQVSALSGYVKTGGGEELVFSMVVNGVAQTSTRVGVLDEMVNQLANYGGKID
ncbi:MAG: D-alanyl-D-alanine carboxypeptidase/D-alanyl-D-alanine-endopeptidase [Pyrinomonadaceae bacterium]